VERAHTAFSKAQTDAATALHEAYAAFTRDLASTQSKALAEIDRKLAERTALALAAIEAATRNATLSDAVVSATPPAASPVPPLESTAPTGISPDPTSDLTAPPKRPRKARREDGPPTVVSNNSELSSAPAAVEKEEASIQSSPVSPTAAEPVPIPVDTIPEIQPVAPDSAGPFSSEPAEVSTPSNDSNSAPTMVVNTPANGATPVIDSTVSLPQAEHAPRKRAPRKTIAEATADVPFQLASDELPPADEASVADAEMAETVISSDGATRLIATSYIGIGNRLFIRGEGPGLSWEKGIPLQFVSIGKWRWETTDAASSISFKLYKNDQVECPGLGTLVLQPGHQQEVTAKF
jgi:hypothetical protein